MAEEWEDEIKCPYCGAEFQDSWEFDDHGESDEPIDCVSCDRKFLLTVHHNVQYSTFKVDCGEGKHEFTAAEFWDSDAETCARWNKDKFLGRTDHVPDRLWSRECKNCDEQEHKRAAIGSQSPWPQKQVA